MKGNINILLFTVLAALLLAGCNKSGVVEALELAETLMQDRPDSSLTILETIDKEQLTSRKEHALYALLLTQAQDKNYIDKTNDSLISVAVDYYVNTKDQNHKMLAHYYKARINFNAKNYSKSIISLFKAEDAAKELNDHYHLGLIYRTIADIYSRVYNHVEQLTYAEKAYKSFKNTGCQDYIDWALYSLARAYHNHKDYITSISLTQQVIDTALVRDNSYLLVAGLSLSGISSYASKNYKDAITYYNKIKEIGEEHLTANDYCLLGISYYNIGKIDSAAICRNKVKSLDPSEKRLEYILNKYYGNYVETITSLEHENNSQNKIVSEVIHQTVSETVSNHFQYEQLVQNDKIAKQKFTITLAIIALIIVMTFATAIIILIQKNHKKDIDNKILLIADLKNSLNITGANTTELQSVIANLYKSKFEDLNKLCSNYYEYKGSKNEKERTYREITNIISEIGTKSRTIKEIEKFINTYQNNILKSFKRDFPKISEDDYLMFIYLITGFAPRAISVFLNKELDIIYNKKSRLKKKIENSSSSNRDLYLESMS